MGNVEIVFDHVHLISKDPAAAARWYVDILGGTIAREMEMYGTPQIMVRIDKIMVIIRGGRPGENPGNNKPLQHFEGFISHDQWGTDHFGFNVIGDFIDFCSAIKEKGAKFTVEPFEIRPGTNIAFVEGPDGETIELVERKPG